MTASLSDAAVRGILDNGVAATFPAAFVLNLKSGAPPASANVARTGTVLGVLSLPVTPWAAAATRSKGKNGTWTIVGQAAAGAGTLIGHFSLESSTDTGAADGSQVRLIGTVAGPVAGSGTITITGGAGVGVFSTSQAGVVAVGTTVTIAGTPYVVAAFNGTTGVTLTGAPNVAGATFTTTAIADLIMDNATIANAQNVTENTFSIAL